MKKTYIRPTAEFFKLNCMFDFLSTSSEVNENQAPPTDMGNSSGGVIPGGGNDDNIIW